MKKQNHKRLLYAPLVAVMLCIPAFLICEGYLLTDSIDTAEGPIIVMLQDAFNVRSDSERLRKRLEEIDNLRGQHNIKRFSDKFDQILYFYLKGIDEENKGALPNAIQYLSYSYKRYNGLDLAAKEEFCRLEKISDYNKAIDPKKKIYQEYEEQRGSLIQQLKQVSEKVDTDSIDGNYWSISLQIPELIKTTKEQETSSCPLIYRDSSIKMVKEASSRIAVFVQYMDDNFDLFRQYSSIIGEGNADDTDCCCDDWENPPYLIGTPMSNSFYILKRPSLPDTVIFFDDYEQPSGGGLKVSQNELLAAIRGECYLSAVLNKSPILQGLKNETVAIYHDEKSLGTRSVNIRFLFPNLNFILFIDMMRSK